MENRQGILPWQVNNEDQEMLVRSFYGGGKSVFFIIIPQFHVSDAFHNNFVMGSTQYSKLKVHLTSLGMMALRS
jgi:hypothetical protein